MKPQYIRFVITNKSVAQIFTNRLMAVGFAFRMVNEGETQYLDVFIDYEYDVKQIMYINDITNRKEYGN